MLHSFWLTQKLLTSYLDVFTSLSVGLNFNLIWLKYEQAQRRATAGRSRHKSHGVIQYYGSYFPTRSPKWMFIIPIVLVEKKHTKLIYHIPWLYQYPSFHFHRSKKIGKMTHLAVKTGIFKKCQKSSIYYGTRFSQPKHHIPR